MLQWQTALVQSSLILLVACGGPVDDDDDDDTTNPIFPTDGSGGAEYGPENSWYHALESDIPEGLEGTGFGAGDIASNIYFSDQYGDEVELYQFYGQVILLDVYAEW